MLPVRLMQGGECETRELTWKCVRVAIYAQSGKACMHCVSVDIASDDVLVVRRADVAGGIRPGGYERG